ncbi:MAG TPA: protein kinase [Ktedonobacterales bacterium]|nr:protein kinase [Ktedonobacterales bacterium]
MTSASLYCPKCGGKNEPDAETCFACGESMLAAAAVSASAALAPGVTRELPLTNNLIKGRYRIVKRLGSGGFGAVYQAEDVDLGNRLVAVKEVRSGGALATQELQEATEAFHREALLLAGLTHPSLPRIHDHFSEGDHWYLVMEFINGETLERRLERSPNRHLSVKEALHLAIKLCEVLEYLHTRTPPIIFRDLKPGNVMLTPDDNVYLIDFGIARLFKPGQQKDTMAFGSPGYAAPEQYGKAQTTPRSDVFSLGALLHHLLTGVDPSDTPFRFAPLTMPRPTGLGTFIGQMVSLDEYKRPPTMGMVKYELERLAAAWAERQRAQTTTTAFPTYQAATGYLPAVPRYPPGAAPTQAGPHWMPPHATGMMYPAPPAQAQPSVWGQSTGMMRTIGPPQPYPGPAMVPMTRPTRARSRLSQGQKVAIGIFISLLMIFIFFVILFLASYHSTPPPATPPYP